MKQAFQFLGGGARPLGPPPWTRACDSSISLTFHTTCKSTKRKKKKSSHSGSVVLILFTACLLCLTVQPLS